MPQKNYQVDFKDIKSRVTMEMVLRRYGVLDKLKARGDNLIGVCPIHGSGSNPNQFSVHPEKNIWNCFGDCKAGGNVLDFVSRKEGVSIRKAALLLQDWFLRPGSPSADPANGMAVAAVKKAKPNKTGLDKGKSDGPINPPLKFALKNLSPEHRWFAERGVSPATVEYFGLGLCGRGLLAGRIAIPIRNLAGELVAYAGRAVDEAQEKAEGKYKLPANFSKLAVVYNLDRQLPGRDLILVESFLSVWALHQAGYPNAVALMGSSLGEDQADQITALLGDAGRALLFFDPDPAGEICTRECQARLGGQVWTRSLHLDKKPHRSTAEELGGLLEKHLAKYFVSCNACRCKQP
jgi:DNA primase